MHGALVGGVVPVSRSSLASVVVISLFCGLILASGVTVVHAQSPSVSVYVADEYLEPGAEVPIELQILNEGTGVPGEGTITSATVTVEDTPFDVNPETSPIGTIPDGEMRVVSPVLTVPADVDPDDYELSGVVEYQYANGSAVESFDVTVSVREEPRFDLETVEHNLAPGGSGTIEFEIENTGAETAYDLRASLAGEGGLILGDGESTDVIGDLEAGESVVFAVDASLSESAGYGEKSILGEMTYRDANGIERATGPVRGSLTPASAPNVSFTNVTSDLAVGQEGVLSGEVTNEGPDELRNAAIVLTPQSESVIPTETRVPIGNLDSNETSTFETSIDVAPGADPGLRDLEATIEYRGGDWSRLTTDPVDLYVEVGPEQSFSISQVEDTLAVGYDGEITGQLTNEGPNTIDDGVIVIEVMSESLFVEDTRYALPSVDPGETVSFRYPTDVSGSADEGPRQVRFTVEYGGAGGQTHATDPMSARVNVEPRMDEFSLQGITTNISPGQTGELVVEMTNERPETLSNIDARMYASSPLSVVADSAFVPELAPGESAEISFEYRADGNARHTTYPVEFDFEYTTERGQTELSTVYQFPVEVVESGEPDDSWLSPFLVAAVLVGIGVIGGAIWWRRR